MATPPVGQLAVHFSYIHANPETIMPSVQIDPTDLQERSTPLVIPRRKSSASRPTLSPQLFEFYCSDSLSRGRPDSPDPEFSSGKSSVFSKSSGSAETEVSVQSPRPDKRSPRGNLPSGFFEEVRSSQSDPSRESPRKLKRSGSARFAAKIGQISFSDNPNTSLAGSKKSLGDSNNEISSSPEKLRENYLRTSSLVSLPSERLRRNRDESGKRLHISDGEGKSNKNEPEIVIKFADLPPDTSKNAQSSNTNFIKLWNKYEFPAEMQCNAASISQTVNEILKRKIREQMRGDFFNPDADWHSTTPDRLRSLVKTVQNGLIVLSPIQKRLNCCYRQLMSHSIDTQKKTELTNLFYKVLGELKDSLTCYQDDSADSQKRIKETNLHEFLKVVSKVKKKSDTAYKLIARIFGDSEDEIKGVIKVLKNWKDSAAKVNLLENSIQQINLKVITSLVHYWDEPIVHEFEGIPPAIDKITPRDMIENYIRTDDINQMLAIPITINGKKPFEAYTPGCDRYAPDFIFFELLSSMYRAFNYPISKNTLQKEVQDLLAMKKEPVWNNSLFTKETLESFRILKMGVVNAAFRADSFLKHRFDGLFKGPLKLGNLKNNALHFNIEKDNVYVEHLRDFKIADCDIKIARNETDITDNRIKAVIPISLKVHYPKEGICRFALRMFAVEVMKDAEPHFASAINRKVLHLNNDAFVEEQLKDCGIKISCKFQD